MHKSSPKDNVPKRVEIDDGLHAIAESQCPKYLSVTGFINLILDQGLEVRVDSGCTIPAYRVGAGPQVQENRQSSLQQPSLPTDQATSAPSEAVRSSTKKADRVVPQCVYHHTGLIEEFWKVKKGGKSETAWKLLMTELEKIQDAYGDKRVDEQLRLAINGKWASVSLRNLQRFENNTKSPNSGFDFEAINGMSI